MGLASRRSLWAFAKVGGEILDMRCLHGPAGGGVPDIPPAPEMVS